MKVQQKGRVIWMERIVLPWLELWQHQERKIRLRLSELPHDDFSWLCPDIHTSWNSVATARAVFFATLGNKLRKITKIFEELDPIKSRGVLCQL